MKRKYQNNYAAGRPQMYDTKSRKEKALRIIKTLQDHLGKEKLKDLTLLDLGASTGIISYTLAKYFKKVIAVDIDKKALESARKCYFRPNLIFRVDDAMKLSFGNNYFDVVTCTQVYEHVPNAYKLFNEIYRVLKPGGVCYLATMNALWPIEPHYNLLFLSWLPKALANAYVKITGIANQYYENPLTYWGLKKLTLKFKQIDYTQKITANPIKFGYPLHTPHLGTFAKYIAPTIFWILIKEANS
jgi:ubiquinone/menaquinone biosynthesis C-methylase UbiE